ncbi:MAG: VTC domain-containing protein [Kordiimonadaceae bacterium]|jgi:hypothetical protein|nr:VTC domain-containing protein [Kordiimonadaceae bacterium]MBT6036470.1 VTC domain-containing protein [Kordiimonadaceae bacterium]MBT6329383.1 VTC domain-containing protein [Kordiimonadaceae bacterium]
MNKNTTVDYQDWRYERKIRVDTLGVRGLEALILSNKAFFRTLHAERRVNNIYFDDDDFNCFFSNVDGNAAREKFRIRWYGDVFGDICNPILEIKIKDALVGSKKRFRLNDFNLNRSMKKNPIKKALEGLDTSLSIRSDIKRLRPTLINSYIRRYYISSDGKYRLTLDYDLEFYKFEAVSRTILSKRSQPGLVVEIKYDVKDDSGVDEVTNDLLFRITKNSKYATGVEITQY